ATALKPTAAGGTPIDPALRLALKQNWESDLRFVVLISDGIFDESELESLPELRNNMINLVAMSSGEPIPLFDFHLFMEDKKELPEKLASFVLPQMIEGFYQEL
ncbi:MAG: VWA domain-containing protein, partial [Nitrososphaerota archaeon]|nr:VWA domain-containing protein [Nitrososphaerota archaeon]